VHAGNIFVRLDSYQAISTQLHVEMSTMEYIYYAGNGKQPIYVK